MHAKGNEGMTTWDTPTEIDNIRTVFPASVHDLMPAWEDIPAEFRNMNARSGSWNHWASSWFFKGLDKFPDAKDGIDQNIAVRHLKAIMSSWEPKHEHKEAAVAYLASLWLTKPEGIKA